MSSRREGLIRILALLQRKTLTETKHCTLKCLKWHYLTVWSGENVAVLTEDRAFALFFRPHPGGSVSSRDPTAGNLPFKPKKMLMPGDQPGEGGGGLGIAEIDWRINGRPSWFWITLMDRASLSALDLDNLIWSYGKKEIVNSLRKNSKSLLFLSLSCERKWRQLASDLVVLTLF